MKQTKNKSYATWLGSTALLSFIVFFLIGWKEILGFVLSILFLSLGLGITILLMLIGKG